MLDVLLIAFGLMVSLALVCLTIPDIVEWCSRTATLEENYQTLLKILDVETKEIGQLRGQVELQSEEIEKLNLCLGTLERERDEMRTGIRKHRDAKGHDRCKENNLELYALLEDGTIDADPELPPLPEFMAGCARYWQEELPRCNGSSHVESVE